MSNIINCVKITHQDSYAWMVSTKDKYYGEVVAGKSFKQEAQNYDLSVNWLVIDIIDENREYLEKELTVQRYTVDGQKFEELDTYAQQLALETHVQQLIARGAFGHKIFKNFRRRLVDLISENEKLDRTYETVKIGMMLRYVKTPPCLVTDNQGYIPVEQVKSGEFKIGLTDAEFQVLTKNIWFGENLIKNIHIFLLTEYAGRDYVKQMKEAAAVEKFLSEEKINADNKQYEELIAQEKAIKGSKEASSDVVVPVEETSKSKSRKVKEDKDYPELLSGSDDEGDNDEKKVVEMS